MHPEVKGYVICPFYAEECRHCSHETRVSDHYTCVVKDPVSGLFKPVSRKKIVQQLGAYCNNIGQWVRDLTYCPAKMALSKKCYIKECEMDHDPYIVKRRRKC